MAKTVTLSSLRSQARERADMVGSNFVTDAELTQYINNSKAELHDILIQKFGEDYKLSSNTFSTVVGTDEYDLPSDFYKLRGVDARVNGSDYEVIRKFNFNERNNYQNVNGWTAAALDAVRYRLWGDKIKFTPAPNSIHSVRLWYYPVSTDLSGDDDTLDGVNGYEEYVIVDAAIKCLQKEESDVSILMAQKQALLRRIEEAASNRDANEPERISDIYAPDYDYLKIGSSE